MAVAIVVEPGTACAPADLLVVNAGLARDVGEGSVAIVVKKDIVSPEAAEQIVPAIVVVVADADAGLPAGAGEAGFVGNVSEGAVAIVFVEMRSGSLAGWPVRVETRAVGQVNVEPAVVIVIEKGEAAAFGFDDGALVIDRAPDVGSVEAGFASYVDKGNRGGCRCRRDIRVKLKNVFPAPQRRGERIEQSAAEDHQRRAEKVTAGKIHGLSTRHLGKRMRENSGTFFYGDDLIDGNVG